MPLVVLVENGICCLGSTLVTVVRQISSFGGLKKNSVSGHLKVLSFLLPYLMPILFHKGDFHLCKKFLG